MKTKVQRINCNHCLRLFITHDPKRRWGCSSFGFKSNFIPSIEVKKITGMECAYFSPKERNRLQRKVKFNSNGRLA